MKRPLRSDCQRQYGAGQPGRKREGKMTEYQQLLASSEGLTGWIRYAEDCNRAVPSDTPHQQSGKLGMLMVVSFAGLALSLFAVERFPALVAAIATLP
jgi:hypothetical protein